MAASLAEYVQTSWAQDAGLEDALMRICLFGNQGNKNFGQVRCLRRRGHAADLVYFPGREGKRSDPAIVDPRLAESSPEWLRPLDRAPSDADLRSIESEYDVVIAAGNRAIRYAGLFDPERIPLILATTGVGNVDGIPQGNEKQRDKWNAMERAAVILTANPVTAKRVASRGHQSKLRFAWPLEDVAAWDSAIDQHTSKVVNEQYGGFSRVFGWFSRSIMDRENPAYKGVEHFIDGAARFIQRNPGQSVRFIFGCHGPDAEVAKLRVRDTGLEPWTDIINHLNFNKLLGYLSLRNGIVFDNLGQRLMTSGIFRDALICGTPVVRNIDQEELELLFGKGCPVRHADDAESCAGAMEAFVRMSDDELLALRAQARRWTEEHLNWTNHIDRLEHIISDTITIQRMLDRGNKIEVSSRGSIE